MLERSAKNMRRDVVIVGIVMLLLGIGVGYLIGFAQFLGEIRRTFEEVSADIAADRAGKSSDVKVRVVGSQYSWDFHYPGPDGVFGESSLELILETNRIGLDFSDPAGEDDFSTNELVLPCGTTVGLIVTSADVIHAIGELEGDFTADAIPGSDITNGLLTPEVPRNGRLRCVQLCGVGHADHNAKYRFVTAEDFAGWLAGQHSNDG